MTRPAVTLRLVVCALIACLAAAGCSGGATDGAAGATTGTITGTPGAPSSPILPPAASGPAPPPTRSALPTDPAHSPLVGVSWTLEQVDRGLSYQDLQSIGAWFLLSPDGTLRFSDGINDGSGRYSLTADGFVTRDVSSSAVGIAGLDPVPYRVMQGMAALLRGATVDPTPVGPTLVARADQDILTFRAHGSQPPERVPGSVAPQSVPPTPARLLHPVCSPKQLRALALAGKDNALEVSLQVVTLTNGGPRTCAVFGYPYVLARDENHLPVRVSHLEGPLPTVPDPGPQEVDLAPGGHAWFTVASPRFYERSSATIGQLDVVPGGLDAAGGGGVPAAVTLQTSSDGLDFLLAVTAYAPGQPPASRTR